MSETTAGTIATIEAAVLHAVDAIIHPTSVTVDTSGTAVIPLATAGVIHTADAVITAAQPAAVHAEAAPSEPVKTVDVVAAEPAIESTEIKLGPTNVGE